ncbi:MAG: DUF2958 domain-containing protein [Deltaproteobacteria bacterium]|nr:DUF2958 domain-containing protein [Deltaproteobacteria bacterium]
MFRKCDLPPTIPALYAQEESPDATVYAHLFLPGTKWHWFLTEWNGDDEAFGLVVGHEIELGYFGLSELEQLRSRLVLHMNNAPDEGGYRVREVETRVMLDPSFSPTLLSVIRARFEPSEAAREDRS